MKGGSSYTCVRIQYFATLCYCIEHRYIYIERFCKWAPAFIYIVAELQHEYDVTFAGNAWDDIKNTYIISLAENVTTSSLFFVNVIYSGI